MSIVALFRLAILRLIIAVITPVLFIGCSKEANQQQGGFPPPQVSVAEVLVRDVTPWDEFNGRIEAVETVQVRPRVGGVIEAVRYQEGDIVKQDDLLFVLDQRPFRAELEVAEAELERARAQAELSRVDSQRARDLFKQNLISHGEYDQRIAAETQANASVRSATANLQLARLNIGYTRIRSPIAGRTGRALFTRGNLVASEPTPDVLTTVVSLDPVYVYFDCDESTYLHFSRVAQQTGSSGKKDITVLVGLGNEEGFPRQGKLDFVDNQVDPNTGTIRLRAVLDNKNHELTPGLFARVKLLEPESEQMVLIDDKAILTDQDRKYVYVLGPENRAMRRDISMGRSIEGLRIVTAGLQQGDRIIVHGIQKVFFPGMPVSPETINMGDPPPMPGPPPGSEQQSS